MDENLFELAFSSIAFIGLLVLSVKRIVKYLKFNDEVNAKVLEVRRNYHNDALPIKLIVSFSYGGKAYTHELNCFLNKKPAIGTFIKVKLVKDQPFSLSYYGKNNWYFKMLTIIDSLLLIMFLFFILNSISRIM